MDNIYKRGIGKSFGLPENALQGRDATRLLDQIAEIQKEKLDDFLVRPEFWDDLNKIDQGRMSREDLLDRWQNGGSRLPPLIPLPTPKAATPKPKTKPKKKLKPKPLVLDPLVIRGRTIVRTEPVVWFDEEKKHPMIIKAYYNDGTTRIFVLDSSGQFISCEDELLPMSRGNRVQPVTIIRRGTCAVLPAAGGLKRPPGPVRGN
jgi:hypothetical protein